MASASHSAYHTNAVYDPRRRLFVGWSIAVISRVCTMRPKPRSATLRGNVVSVSASGTRSSRKARQKIGHRVPLLEQPVDERRVEPASTIGQERVSHGLRLAVGGDPQLGREKPSRLVLTGSLAWLTHCSCFL